MSADRQQRLARLGQEARARLEERRAQSSPQSSPQGSAAPGRLGHFGEGPSPRPARAQEDNQAHSGDRQ